MLPIPLGTLGAFDSKVRPILGSIRSTGIPEAPHPTPHAVLPFVTISRQAGAGARSLAALLTDRLNAADPGERRWEYFDRELVEKVANDYHISKELIASLEDSSHTWLDDFFAGLPGRGTEAPSEIKVFHRVAATVRALAQAGRVILVGCGAGYITSNMPGGLHIRLVARFEHRIATMSRLHHLTLDEAAKEVRRLDHNRQAFYKRYWPDKPLSSEQFDITFNSSSLTEEQMVACLLPLILEPRPRRGTSLHPISTPDQRAAD